MLRKFKPRAPGLLIALVVLAVAATSGSAVAGSLITSKQIKNGTIKLQGRGQARPHQAEGRHRPAGSPGTAGRDPARRPARPAARSPARTRTRRSRTS